MGYRSDVTIAFYTQDTGKLPTAAIKLWFEENYPVEEAKEEWDASVEYCLDAVLVTYVSVKWYPNYNHPQRVKAARDLFNETFECDSNDSHACWEMVTVGEDVNDNTHESSTYAEYRLGIRRDIVWA